MMRAHEPHRHAGAERQRLVPVRTGRGDAITRQQRVVAQTRQDTRVIAFRQSAESIDVEMVVMVVADEDEVDRRQIGQLHARRADALRAGETHRRSALGPDGIE